MHEVSLMEQALDLALDYARQNGAAQIRSLTLTVGEQSGVVPEALRFAFEVVAEETLAQGAELIIRSAPLLTMLNSCATGIGVVNIDNGFGAAMLAGQILRVGARLGK